MSSKGSNYKNTKTELIAIYRLEFYKKQKKWKLSHAEKNKNSDPRAKVVLNETYNIDSGEPQVDPPTALNDAFLGDESDNKSPSTEQPKSPSPLVCSEQDLGLQELEPHEDIVDADNNWITPIEPHQQQNYIEPLKVYESEWWPDPVEPVPPTVTPEVLAGDKWDPADYGIQQEYHLQDVGEAGPWPAAEPYVDPRCPCWGWEHLAQEYALGGEGAWWTEAKGAEMCEAEEVRRVLPLLKQAEDWLRNKDTSRFQWDPSLWADESADSEDSFVRGAHAAPHSSELELERATCSCRLRAASCGELRGRLARRAAGLRGLLRELHHRTLHKQHAPYNQRINISYELPTRDTGLATPQPHQSSQHPPSQSPLSDEFHPSPTQLSFPSDPFVAGSFVHLDIPVGRGRGRRLIGIGMGRPYRL